ncbi:uncharacterized protein TNCV_3646551 [Trichonephila clavipes]|nr:uncharacterized protein TNCV_3646551 [Trichonephila clavipes]
MTRGRRKLHKKKELAVPRLQNKKSARSSILSPPPECRGILIGQRKGSLRGRVCGGRVACVVGDGSKERSAESGPRGRGTWLRMARRRGLLHIEKSSLASALDRARQHVMGFPRCLALKNPPAVTLGTLEKFGNSWPGGGRDGTRRNPCSQNKMETTKENSVLVPERLSPPAPKKNSLLPGPTVSSLRHRQPVSIFNSSPIEEQQISTFTSSKQALALASLKQLAHFDIQVKQHATLNYSRGVISAADLYNVTEEEILENMAEQNVSQVAYLHCPVRPYIPNPLRCFQCQRFGHSKTTCRGQPTCARCAEVGHDSADCKAKEKCVNCKGDHPSYSRSCPTWSIEKEITALKIKNKISYPEARRIVSSRTPVSGISYAAITRKMDTSKPVSTPPHVKKTRKTRIKESGVLASKKKRSNLSKKPHDMGEDVMEIHASQSDESLLDDLSPKPSSSGSLRGASAKS